MSLNGSNAKLTKKVLKDYMAAYGLPKSGNRDVLINRLRGFANAGEKFWEKCVCLSFAHGTVIVNLSGC